LKQRDLIDLIGGLLMFAIGLFVALYARRYDFGTPARMGSGFFPQVLGWILAVLGVLIAAPAWFRRAEAFEVRWKSTFFVISALLLFGLLLRSGGLLLATFAASMMALGAEENVSWRTRVLISFGVAVVTVTIFIGGLGMILPVLPTFWS
jgi:hypothetical protein